ncbi:MAG TPA: amino acid ABC transporter permease [Actinomycetota bacterium]|jgi:polar amino acid transport system permease protein|nr:amino acid ABC transporter permease [Actinomycetota bacterium]
MGQPGPDPDVPFTSGGVPPMPSGGGRWPKVLGGGDATARNVWIGVVSTLVFFGLLALIVVRSPGWPEIKRSFFDASEFKSSFPVILRKFVRNIAIFCIAEVLVLMLALVIAVARSLPGPVFTPIRIMAAAYTDLFRGVPTILVILILGYGMPALDLQGVPDNDYIWAVVALTLVYSAYVAEVYRAGIQSVHPSQVAAARSLGLSRWQSLRHVVLPQAVRRVIPPLLNDFIGLQKDSALVYVLGVVEALNQATIIQSGDFNFTPLVALSVIFIAITIPQARFVDWLIARDQRKRQSSVAV